MTIPINTNDAARTAHNRANAAHSTGPKTEAGKKRSSLNAYRHGLTGQTIIPPAEDLEACQDFTHTFFKDYKPVGTLEKQLVSTVLPRSRAISWPSVSMSTRTASRPNIPRPMPRSSSSKHSAR
jgi:hypothetical protein